MTFITKAEAKERRLVALTASVPQKDAEELKFAYDQLRRDNIEAAFVLQGTKVSVWRSKAGMAKVDRYINKQEGVGLLEPSQLGT